MSESSESIIELAPLALGRRFVVSAVDVVLPGVKHPVELPLARMPEAATFAPQVVGVPASAEAVAALPPALPLMFIVAVEVPEFHATGVVHVVPLETAMPAAE